MLRQYLSEDQIRAISYTSLLYSGTMLLDMPLHNSTEYLTHLPTGIEGEILSRKEELVSQHFDYGPVNNCFISGESKLLLKFDGDDVEFS